MICNFNAKLKQRCQIDKTNFEGSKIELLTSKFGSLQIITESTHILENSRSCIDLLFMSQPNMVIYSGVHASLLLHCHHQLIFAKFDLKVFYPPPYERTMCHFSQVNSDHIKRAVELNVNEQLCVFNDTITNMISNLVPNKIIFCDD